MLKKTDETRFKHSKLWLSYSKPTCICEWTIKYSLKVTDKTFLHWMHREERISWQKQKLIIDIDCAFFSVQFCNSILTMITPFFLSHRKFSMQECEHHSIPLNRRPVSFSQRRDQNKLKIKICRPKNWWLQSVSQKDLHLLMNRCNMFEGRPHCKYGTTTTNPNVITWNAS